MSNLSLPTLTFEALRPYILKGRNKFNRTVANNTVAELSFDGDTVFIAHHGSTIATLTAHSVTVTNAGYGSASTRERINGILSSNHIGHYVAQRQGAQVLFDRGAGHVRVSDHFRSATFEQGGLTAVNGEKVRILATV